MLAITGAGIRAADPAGRLADPRAARAAAARIVNRRVGTVADFGLRAAEAGRSRRGTVLSDPPSDPTAYHALSAFMLDLAVRELGPDASRSARRTRRATLEALALLVSPAGNASYLGRGQDQVWVPAVTAAALAAGARAFPARAPRYLGAARAALRRLERRHATRDRGFDVVPHAEPPHHHRRARPVRAHRRLQRPGAVRAHRRPRRAEARPGPHAASASRRRPAPWRSPTRAAPASASPRTAARGWPSTRSAATRATCATTLGLLALEQRRKGGWHDLLAPRPRTETTADTAGPALVRAGVALPPIGSRLEASRAGRVRYVADYRAGTKLVRRVTLTYTLTRRGARLRLSGAKRGDVFRLLAFTPAGTGRGRRAASTPPGTGGDSTARWRSAASRATTRPRWSSSTPSRRSSPSAARAASASSTEVAVR